MTDPTELEIKAMEAAAKAGGEYLDSIGVTDLPSLSYEQWMTFIESVCTEYRMYPPF